MILHSVTPSPSPNISKVHSLDVSRNNISRACIVSSGAIIQGVRSQQLKMWSDPMSLFIDGVVCSPTKWICPLFSHRVQKSQWSSCLLLYRATRGVDWSSFGSLTVWSPRSNLILGLTTDAIRWCCLLILSTADLCLFSCLFLVKRESAASPMTTHFHPVKSFSWQEKINKNFHLKNGTGVSITRESLGTASKLAPFKI